VRKPLQDIGYKYVKAILQKDGEISIEDIKSMPFFNDDSEYNAVINSLKREYDVKIISKKTSSWPILEWEEVISLCH
jgi:hypothetical protein